MLLIAGGDADPQIVHLIARAEARGVPHRPLLHRAGGGLLLDWSLETGVLRENGAVIEASGAFVRQDVFRFLSTKRPIDRDDARHWKVLLDGWLWSHPEIRLFNRGFAMRDAVNKPLALIRAREAGLPVPQTTLHSSVAVAARALEQGAVVYKPVAGGDMARELDMDALGKVHEPYLPRPYIFQEKLVPPEIRMFRVGERFFAFRVEADTLDYRTAGGDVTVVPVEAPAHLLDGLTQVTDFFGLTYAAADFKARDGSGELVFLEVNSNPMFLAFDRACDGALCDAMLDWLTPSPDTRSTA